MNTVSVIQMIDNQLTSITSFPDDERGHEKVSALIRQIAHDMDMPLSQDDHDDAISGGELDFPGLTVYIVMHPTPDETKMKTITVECHQTVAQQVQFEVTVPEHLAEKGGNELREWIQENNLEGGDKDGRRVIVSENIEEDLQDLIVWRLR